MPDQHYDEAIREQIDYVKKISESKLLQQTSGGENVLDVSDTGSLLEVTG
jgi:COP9 signalosome complex subunit 3